jgi:hypothetical protein
MMQTFLSSVVEDLEVNHLGPAAPRRSLGSGVVDLGLVLRRQDAFGPFGPRVGGITPRESSFVSTAFWLAFDFDAVDEGAGRFFRSASRSKNRWSASMDVQKVPPTRMASRWIPLIPRRCHR